MLESKRYSTIVADPPWPEYGGGKIRRGANKHYSLMSLDEIKSLEDQVKAWRSPEGCHLYLWVTNNYLPAGLEVMAAWGFAYRTCITWGKITETGTLAIGLGQYFRGASEHCLFGVYGHLPYRMTDGDDPKRGQGRTLILAPRQEHSQKPDALIDMAEVVSHPPRLEMFAREHRLGWDVWGNETGVPHAS